MYGFILIPGFSVDEGAESSLLFFAEEEGSTSNRCFGILAAGVEIAERQRSHCCLRLSSTRRPEDHRTARPERMLCSAATARVKPFRVANREKGAKFKAHGLQKFLNYKFGFISF